MEENTVSVFYSYSHKDESLRDSLETHLAILSRKGLISNWHDRRITPSKEWAGEIDYKIKNADLILLLVSPDFIASDYCYSKEVAMAIENHESNKSIVIPIIIRPVEWLDAPFASLQALPKDAKPVTSWQNEDEAWLDTAKGIKSAVENIRANKNRKNEKSGFLSMRDMLEQEIKRIDVAFNSMTAGGISTGLTDLDHVLTGIHESQLVVIAGRPMMGKTSLALKIASHAAIRESKPVAFFSLKIPAIELTRNLISSIGYLSSHTLLSASLDETDWPKLLSAVEKIKDAPLYIDECPSLSIDQIRKKANEMKDMHAVKLIIIDSIQHLSFNSDNSNNEESIIEYSKELKRLAKELKIAIILTVSLPKHIDERVNKRPVLNDLSNWEGLPEDSDIVLGSLWVSRSYLKSSSNKPYIAAFPLCLILCRHSKKPR